jgi:YesN/AraC family two-component response regulator
VSALHTIFFGASLAIIAATLFFYLKKRDVRRFLTTMHLSVLDPTVQKGCRYVESHYMNPKLAVNDVCVALVTGEAYLNALFVKEIGISVQDFITQVRVNSVKYLLAANPGCDPGRICAQSGFADKGTAEKSFARLCGIEIEEYVKSLPK